VRNLLIDDKRDIETGLIARDYDSGIIALKTAGPFEVLYLDHDLGDEDPHKTGYGIMCFLEENPQLLPKRISLVTSNPVGRKNMLIVINRLYGDKS